MYPINSDYSNLKTFVINLDDYKANYTKQLPFLENIGLKVERFSGINALKDQHLLAEFQPYISIFAKNFTPKSVIGCALSHILCCKHIYNNCLKDNPYILIMEDDAFPLYNKNDFYEKLNKTIYEIQVLDSNWDIIQLHSDCILPTHNTYNTHIASGSTAAYLISLKAIIKTLNSKIYSHIDFIQHNFLKYNKYRAKENLFYTNEKHSLNRIKVNKYYSLSLKAKFLEFFNYYTQMIPLRGEKKYQHFLEFKLLREPIYNKEFNANDLIDYFLGFIIIRKLINNIAKI